MAKIKATQMFVGEEGTILAGTILEVSDRRAEELESFGCAIRLEPAAPFVPGSGIETKPEPVTPIETKPEPVTPIETKPVSPKSKPAKKPAKS